MSVWLRYDIFHMHHSVTPYAEYVDSSYRRLSGSLLYFCHKDRPYPRREAWGLVGGRSRACCWWSQEDVIMFTICFVSNRHCISLWLGYDILHLYHSVTLYVKYVDSSYRTLSGHLLYLGHEHCSPPGRDAWGFVDDRSRACCSCWQEGVEVPFSHVCKIRYLICLENPFMSRYILVIVFCKCGLDTIFFICVTVLYRTCT